MTAAISLASAAIILGSLAMLWRAVWLQKPIRYSEGFD